MKKKQPPFYIQPTLFGLVKIDKSTPAVAEGIVVNNTPFKRGLLFVKDDKMLFMQINSHLSASSIADTLLLQKEWLGGSYKFYMITSVAGNADKKEQEKANNAFITALEAQLTRASFKWEEYHASISNHPVLLINRQGHISPLKNEKEIQTDPHKEIREAIYYLNYFTGIEKKESTLHSGKLIGLLLGQNTVHHPYMQLDVHYDKTHWASLPVLNETAALATRHYKSSAFKTYPSIFFESLSKVMPEEIEMRIFLASSSPQTSSINLNEAFNQFKKVFTYYEGLLKQAIGPITQQSVKAYKENDYTTAEKLGREALQIITVSGSPEALAVAHYNVGSSLMQLQRYDEALLELTAAKMLYQKLSNWEKTENCAKKITVCQRKQHLIIFNNSHHMQSIHKAVANNDLVAVQTLMETHPNSLLEKDHYGWTPLTYAVFFRVSFELLHFIADKAPETAYRAYYGDLSEQDKWRLEENASDCEVQYSLLRFALYVPKKFQALPFIWDEKTRKAVIELLLQIMPNIGHLQIPEENDQKDFSDLKYAFLKKAPVSILHLLLDKAPSMVEPTESLIAALLLRVDHTIIQKLIKIDPEGCRKISKEKGIQALFAAVYAQHSLPMIKFLFKQSPAMALQVTGKHFLSGWVGDVDREYVHKPNTTVVILALEMKQFASVNFLLTKVPELAFLTDEENKKPSDVIHTLLTQETLSEKDKKNVQKLAEKISFIEFLTQLPPENIQKVIRIQAIVKGFLSRKTKSFPQLKALYWLEVEQKANALIERLISTRRYAEIAKLAGFISKNSLVNTLQYMRQLKWFDNLPNEIILKIMAYLNGIEVMVLSQVAKRYYSLAQAPLVWKQKVAQELTLTPRPLFIRNEPNVVIKNHGGYYQQILAYGDSNIYYADKRKRALPSSYYTFLNQPKKKWSKDQLGDFLRSAITIGAEKWIIKLLQQGAVPTLDLFHQALIEKKPQCAKILLHHGLNVNSTPRSANPFDSDHSLFHIALGCIQQEILHVLFAQPSITVLPELHQAAALGQLERLKMLLAQGTSANEEDRHHLTPIVWATVMGQMPIVKELMQHHATLSGKENLIVRVPSLGSLMIERSYNLVVLALLFQQWEVARFLLPRFTFLGNLTDMMLHKIEGPSFSLLQVLAAQSDIEGMKLLLEVKPTATRPRHNPLLLAAKYGHTASVKYLLQQKFPVNACLESRYHDGDGCLVRSSETPLGAAATGGYLECIRLLLEAGANPNQSYTQYFYQKRSEPSILSFSGVPLHKLAEYLAQPDQLLEDELSSTSFEIPSFIHTPRITNAIEALQLFLKVTKPVDIIDAYEQQTALTRFISPSRWSPTSRVGIQKKNYEHLILYCVQLCLEAGADIHHRYGDLKQTVLHAAAREGRLDLLAFLLQRGADPAVKDTQGATARTLAKDERCCQLLDEWLLKTTINQDANPEKPTSEKLLRCSFSN